MRWKRKEYVIVDSGEDFLIRIDSYYFGIWLVSEYLLKPFLGSPETFSDYPEAKERIKEILGGKKTIKKKLKLLRNENSVTRIN